MGAASYVVGNRRSGTGFSALDTLTGFSADPLPEVPPRVDGMHNLSTHIPLTSTPKGFRDEFFDTPRGTLEVLTLRGLPSSLNQGTPSGADSRARRGYGGCHNAGAETHEVFQLRQQCGTVDV